MKHNFQIKAIAYESVQHLFSLNASQLKAMDAVKMTVNENPGFPCRVSLKDAEIGEEVMLFSYDHLDAKSPYKAKSPVFIRKNALTANLRINEVPVMLRHRLLSVRAFDQQRMMINAQTTPGDQLETTIQELFNDKKVQFLQIHNAGPGCYNCQVERV